MKAIMVLFDSPIRRNPPCFGSGQEQAPSSSELPIHTPEAQ